MQVGRKRATPRAGRQEKPAPSETERAVEGPVATGDGPPSIGFA